MGFSLTCHENRSSFLGHLLVSSASNVRQRDEVLLLEEDLVLPR